ncbi:MULTISPECIES: dynamin family protein [Micromonospora]|uniref:dynamin family protein n=1 Tax=Micromonospora TaxID=1873 RepID=UPI001319BB61|nr:MULTISPECIES: dynamin family protein [Micromonospora]NES16993.1 hypothetical protein [Micromonospora sp. PPF5-17B]NES38406.1 hypothetical protein [Micromonospora solifontis]NES58726.1 hypothetical protein [Micromonospora sp. PPF5-6]
MRTDLDGLLARALAVADGDDHVRLAALRRRWRERRLRVLVVGEAKRGKSTLVNALLGRPVVPTGVTPVTALPTIVRRGRPERLQVDHLDGHTAQHPLADLPDLVTETGNPDNIRGVADLVVHLDAVLLDDLDLVDTPGVGSVFARSAAATTTALDTMDAAVFVVSADPPISGNERAFLTEVRDRSVALACVINKIDNVLAADRDEVVAFTTGVVTETVHREVPVFPVSARQALAGGDSGIGALRRWLTEDLRARRGHDLAASVAGHTARIVGRLHDAALLRRRAAELTAAQAGDRVELFAQRLDAVAQQRRDDLDIAAATVARMLGELNAAAAADTVRLAGRLRRAVARHVDAQPAARAAELEDRCRAHTVQLIRAEVDRWRDQRERVITAELAALDERLAGAIAAHLAAVRDAARELLDLDLVMPAPAGPLLPPVRVSYDFAEPIGTTVAWSAALRRHLPGRWGRSAVRAHLLDEVDPLLGKQLGRVRSALQQALRASTDALGAAIDDRVGEATGGLRTALAAARATADDADTAALMRALDARIAELAALAADLAVAALPARTDSSSLRDENKGV